MSAAEWTKQDEDHLVSLLERLPQPWPYTVFRALVKILPTTAVEIVILKRVKDKILVHLVERARDDPDFGGEMHFAGTIVRATDKSYDDAIHRVELDELDTHFTSVEFVGNPMLIHTRRGTVTELVYVCSVESDPKVGEFFDIDNLPPNFIDHQLVPLRLAIDYYKSK